MLRISGDDVTQLLDDVLSPREKDELPAIGSQTDTNGSKRLAKLNQILKKSPPLKPWTLRTMTENTVNYLGD